MAEVVVKIPEELKHDFEKISEIDVSLAVTRIVKTEIERLKRLKDIVSKSKLTEKDVQELSDNVDKSLAKRFKQSVQG